MKYTAIIIDDELNGSESLSLLLQIYCPQIEVVSIVDNVDDAVSMILAKKPEIVFSDIEMPSGSGFEVVERTKHFQYQLIFTTAHENHAIKAIRSQAIDYLLKPICIEDLIKAVNSAIEKIDSPQQEEIDSIQKQKKTPAGNKIAIPCSDGLIFVEADKIARIEADSNYTHIIMNDGSKVTACKTLKDFETQLDPEIFFRVHHTHMVNLLKIEKYIKGDGGFVVLGDGALVPVSRAQKQPFLSKFVKS